MFYFMARQGWEKPRSRNHRQRTQRSIKTSAGPLLERKGDLTAILTSLELRGSFLPRRNSSPPGRRRRSSLSGDGRFRVDLVIGQGPGARIHPFHLNHFTLIGATTRAGLITAPLRSRFGIVHRLEFTSRKICSSSFTGPPKFFPLNG